MMILILTVISMIIGLIGGVVWRIIENNREQETWFKKVEVEQDLEIYYKNSCEDDE